MIEVRGLTKRFGAFAALRDVSFDVAAGTVAALWGPNGAGKTTTILCLLGLLQYEGSVRIDGLDAARRPRDVRRRVGYVPQEFAYYDLTVGQSAALFGALKGVPAARVREVLEQAGLAGESAKPVGQLSGGMRQRLALGLALLADPPVLLLDEPAASLDAASRRHFLDQLAGLRERGKTIMLCTHRPEEVLELASRVLIMEQGRLLAVQTPAQFVRTEMGGEPWTSRLWSS